MSIFSFNCKYNTIEAFLGDKNYSSFIMKQGWFQSNKHSELRNQIAIYKKNIDDKYKKWDEEIVEAEAKRKVLNPIKRYAFKQRDPIYQSFRVDSARSDDVINRFRLKQSKYFKSHIEEELIAAAMHPCRMQAQMNYFDDIEDFFDNY